MARIKEQWIQIIIVVVLLIMSIILYCMGVKFLQLICIDLYAIIAVLSVLLLFKNLFQSTKSKDDVIKELGEILGLSETDRRRIAQTTQHLHEAIIQDSEGSTITNSEGAEIRHSNNVTVTNSPGAIIERSNDATVENSVGAQVRLSIHATVTNSPSAEVEKSENAKVENVSGAKIQNSPRAKVTAAMEERAANGGTEEQQTGNSPSETFPIGSYEHYKVSRDFLLQVYALNDRRLEFIDRYLPSYDIAHIIAVVGTAGTIVTAVMSFFKNIINGIDIQQIVQQIVQFYSISSGDGKWLCGIIIMGIFIFILCSLIWNLDHKFYNKIIKEILEENGESSAAE